MPSVQVKKKQTPFVIPYYASDQQYLDKRLASISVFSLGSAKHWYIRTLSVCFHKMLGCCLNKNGLFQATFCPPKRSCRFLHSDAVGFHVTSAAVPIGCPAHRPRLLDVAVSLHVHVCRLHAAGRGKLSHESCHAHHLDRDHILHT